MPYTDLAPTVRAQRAREVRNHLRNFINCQNRTSRDELGEDECRRIAQNSLANALLKLSELYRKVVIDEREN